MTIPRFYLAASLDVGETVPLSEEVVRHARDALRLQDGSALVLFNGQGGEYAGRLVRLQGQWCAQVERHDPRERECGLPLVVMQALPMGERMDWVLQKATELGVERIMPVMARRCVRRLQGARLQRQQEHWRRILIAACEQCGRNRIPQLDELQPWERSLAQLPAAAMKLMLHPRGTRHLSELAPVPSQPIVLAIGPEGDWDPGELALAEEQGFIPVVLGSRILRTDTAAAAAVAAVLARWGDYQ